MLNAAELDNADPPLDAAYHWILLPVAAKLATVGFTALQNTCVADATGASGLVFTITVTSYLVGLSQLLVVWLAK